MQEYKQVFVFQKLFLNVKSGYFCLTGWQYLNLKNYENGKQSFQQECK